MPARQTLLAAARPGLIAVRRHLAPFLLIQALAAAVLLAYALSPRFRDACGTLAAVKDAGGWWLAAAASVVASAVLPELARYASGDRRTDRKRAADFAFNVVVFALVGIVVDYFYRLQAILWGDRADLATVAAKVATDQLVFTLFVALPLITAAYCWYGHAFAVRPAWADLRRGFVRRRIAPVVLPNWAYWVPMTALIYALPAALQFVFWVPANGAWSLLLIFLAKGGGQAESRENLPVPAPLGEG